MQKRTLIYLRNQRNLRPNTEPRGTVLILCVALLVMLGLIASSFVILSHSQRASSRSLTRADQLEQVRQMSLDYVRTVLLEDLVGNDGKFLNGDNNDEPYDTPTTDDSWLSSHTQLTGQEIDTDNDGDVESNWITSSDSKFPGFVNFAPATGPDGNANIIAPDGTRYRVAIRVVDTNGLANINVGAADISDPLWPESNTRLWNSRYPSDLNLRTGALFDSNDADMFLDDGNNFGTVDGRIPGQSNDRFTALTKHLYPYLANTNYTNLKTLGVDYIRPFDIAEELALRMMAGPKKDLNGRLGTLWPYTFDNNNNPSVGNNSHLLTAYSWTMQIRPPAADPAVDAALTSLGFPAPCKVPLSGLVDSGDFSNEKACRAVYLALLATGMNKEKAAQLLVNLIDYIDNDDGIKLVDPNDSTNSIVDFNSLDNSLKPGKYYGTDNQPIISEIYVYRYYAGTEIPPVGSGTYNYTLDPNLSRYAVELFNSNEKDLVLNGWKVDVAGTTYDIPNGTSFPKNTFLTIVSDNNGITLLAGSAQIQTTNQRLEIAIPAGGTQTVKLLRTGPDGLTVAVDRFTATNFAPDPTDGGTVQNPTITEDAERPGRTDPSSGNNIPTIAPFGSLGTTTALGNFPNTTIAPGPNGELQGGQLIIPNRQLHSLGELFYIPTVANTGNTADLIIAMEGQIGGDSNYRLQPATSGLSMNILRYLTLRTGLNDGADNDGDGNLDVAFDAGEPIPSSMLEARVPGLININTAPAEVLTALHYYYGSTDDEQVGAGNTIFGKTFLSTGDFAFMCNQHATITNYWPSKDEDPDGDGVGSPDGITVDNEQKLFHFTNVANLISVRSDVFVVYITIQASDRDGIFQGTERITRTMAIVDRSFCLQPYDTSLTPPSVPLANIPLPRIVAQTTLP